MTIGRTLGYHELANLYRPADPGDLGREVRRLSDEGLKVVDIATALRLNLVHMHELLAERGTR